MGIAVVTTVALILKLAEDLGTAGPGGLVWVLVGLLAGGTASTIMAKRVQMTKMPELVAFMHSMIGMAAVFIAVAAVAKPWAFGITAKGGLIPAGNQLELFLWAAIGAITFSGSVNAFGKLWGKYKFRLFKGVPVVFPGHQGQGMARNKMPSSSAPARLCSKCVAPLIVDGRQLHAQAGHTRV